MADSTFGNRHIVTNVGDNVSTQLPAGTYKCLSGQAPAGLTISETGLITGSPTTPGVQRMVLEYCC